MKLGDVAEINMGQSPNSKYYNSDRKGIEFLQGIRTFGENYPSFDTYTTQYNKISKKGDILFSVRAPVGKVNWSDRKIAIGRGLAALNVLPNFSSKYVYYFLKKVGSQINSISSGTVFSSINKKELANVKILIPDSLKDQEYIGTRLALLDKKIELNNQINDNLSNILLLNLAELINLNKFKLKKISNLEITVSDHVANGSFKSLKNNVSYFDKPNYALFIRNIDFKNNLEGNKKYIDKKSYDYLKKSHLSGGEVVISNVADVGSVHRTPFIKIPMVVGNNQIFIKSEKTFLTDYLYVYFQSFWGQHAIFSITSGSAQQKFNKTDFRSLEVPIPTKDWIRENIQPYLTLQDNIFKENVFLKQIKINLINKYF